MLRTIVLLMTALCLARSASLTRRDDGSEESQELQLVGGEHKGYGPSDLEQGMALAKHYVDKIKSKVDGAVEEINKGEKGRKEWFDIISKVADIMHHADGVFAGAFKETIVALFRMFQGDHAFRRVSQCHEMASLVKERQLGDDESVPLIEKALADDLVCFHLLLEDAFQLDVEYTPGYEPSESEVLDGLLRVFRKLFMLRNDREDFSLAVAAATHAYNDNEEVGGLHDHFIGHFTEEKKDNGDIIERLLRALKAKKENKQLDTKSIF